MAEGTTCICGDTSPDHTQADHNLPKSMVPTLILAIVLGAGYVHAKRTGNCLCGDIYKSFTGRKPRGS